MLTRCDVLSDTDVADDAAPYGFTASEAVAAVNGRTWGVAWVSDKPEGHTALTVASLSMTVSLGSDPVRAVELTEGEGGCAHIGEWLAIPVEVRLTDSDGTFVASGTTTLTASALSDNAMDFDWLSESLELSPVPADATEAGDAAFADQGTTAGEFYLSFEGRLDALFVNVGAVAQDGQGNASVARGQLTAE